MAIWYGSFAYFPRFSTLCQEKPGNPAPRLRLIFLYDAQPV
jgi:hypothetical protein